MVTTLTAVLLRKSPELMFEVVGKSPEPGDAADAAILAAARSFRELRDPARLGVQPDRVKVVAAPGSTDFQGLVQSLGAQALNEEDTEILNNLHGTRPSTPTSSSRSWWRAAITEGLGAAVAGCRAGASRHFVRIFTIRLTLPGPPSSFPRS